jgi:hypothetical protein
MDGKQAKETPVRGTAREWIAAMVGAMGAGAIGLVVAQSAAGPAAAPTVTPVVAPPAVQSAVADLAAEWKARYGELQRIIAARGTQRGAEEVHRIESMILPEDRDPLDVELRRTAALLVDVKRLGPTRDLGAAEARLAELRRLASQAAPDARAAPVPPPVPARSNAPSAAAARGSAEPNRSPQAAAPAGPSAGSLDALMDELGRAANAPALAPRAQPPGRPAGSVEAGAGGVGGGAGGRGSGDGAAASVTHSRADLFARVSAVRREIAFANPLLRGIDKLLLLKTARKRPGHCCDQFFGTHVGDSGPVGGIYTLDNPFGPNPSLRNLLADAVVQNGRLKGQKLVGGSFLSPDVSYDGRVIVFAYTMCKTGAGRTVTMDSAKGIWDPNGAYHVFRVNADANGPGGSDLRQLTDGGFNDFDPCWLPSGRVVFISERRGGYGRCHGRPVPTYTLHSMDENGGDIVTLSYHETNEWNPSVTNDGMILYTRWDYIDRGDCIAHHPWVITPDGRDGRAVQGNFPLARQARPDTEHELRAISGSRRFVGVAAPHHGQNFGSLILIDPDVEDDGAMSPLKRITPDNNFPETQGGKGLYGTAWPLSEDYYLCVYSGTHRDAVYLIDAFGNHELLYYDPDIECLAPMPLGPRPRPPVLPHVTAVGKPAQRPGIVADKAGAAQGRAVVTCVNLYDGLLPWPAGTRIKELRIIQLFPKATPSMGSPNIGRWAESLARGVVGTVPVEADGSAQFTVPAGKTLYFQALDANGLAVQSMQSGAYFHPGERLTCQGCHEHRYRAPAAPFNVPLALRRAPSTPKAEVPECWPVSFPRLVQPVLDAKCVPCHRQNVGKAPDLASPNASVRDSGVPERPRPAGQGSGTDAQAAGVKPPPQPVRRAGGWTPAYNVLSQRGFGRSGKPPSRADVRTVPGEFGAAASKLYQMLAAGHPGGSGPKVNLTAEEMRRITLWLDTNCNFFGDYLNTEAQAAGEKVVPALE